MSGSPARTGATGGLASKQPARPPAPAQAVVSRLSDPKFLDKQEKAAKIVMVLKNKAKEEYPKLANNPEIRFGGRFIHNKAVGTT